MGRKDSREGITIQTDESGIKTMVWGWAAVILGIGIAVSAIVLSNYLGIALTIAAGGLGIGLAAVGVGEGIKRARIGDAARIEAKARMIAARRDDYPRLEG